MNTKFWKKNASTILTIVGAVGVVATTITAIKSTPKALDLLGEAKYEKGEDLTPVEVVKTAGPVYIPTVLIGASTIACIIGANILNKHQQASLMSAYALLDNSYKRYKDKVVELFGVEADQYVRNEIANDVFKESEITPSEDKQLFFDSHSLQYFESTMDVVLEVEEVMKANLEKDGYVWIDEFYDMLEIPHPGNEFGWGWGIIEGTLDFKHDKIYTGDGLEIITIDMINNNNPLL